MLKSSNLEPVSGSQNMTWPSSFSEKDLWACKQWCWTAVRMQWKLFIFTYWTKRRRLRLFIYSRLARVKDLVQSSFWSRPTAPFQNVFYGLFSRWICENIYNGYVKHSIFERMMKKSDWPTFNVTDQMFVQSPSSVFLKGAPLSKYFPWAVV